MLQEERTSMLEENTPYALTQGLKHYALPEVCFKRA
jgi:hypothetical protein